MPPRRACRRVVRAARFADCHPAERVHSDADRMTNLFALLCSLAQAAVSGCGDAYAAGVGVSVANMAAVGVGGLSDVLTNAFIGATTVSRTVRDAAAVSQGIAIAFGSALPCEILRIRPAALRVNFAELQACSSSLHAMDNPLGMHVVRKHCAQAIRRFLSTACQQMTIQAATTAVVQPCIDADELACSCSQLRFLLRTSCPTWRLQLVISQKRLGAQEPQRWQLLSTMA